MQIGIIQFPGSNCERETMLAVKRAGMQPVECFWNRSHALLAQMDGYIIAGGFSYEDRSRAGIIAALDPIMQEIKLQAEKGKPVLGICNGAQILVESGLVPGIADYQVGMALAENKRMKDGLIQGTGYYNAWVNLRLSNHYQRNAFTRYLTQESILSVPIAHAEGRFVMSDVLWREIENQGLHVFQYCDEAGNIEDSFPINPNGSMHNIAAIANKAGNVMAMMPHPERTTNGDAIFHSMRDYIQAAHFTPVAPLAYCPRRDVLTPYQEDAVNRTCLVELMITDNHAMTVQQTLRQMGLPVSIQRYQYWTIKTNSQSIFEQVKQSGVLFNSRKECIVAKQEVVDDQSVCLLVKEKEDLRGNEALYQLRNHFGMHDLEHIAHGIVWKISCADFPVTEMMETLLSTHIFQNQYAHDYYQYQ